MATPDSMPFTVALLSPDQLASLLAELAEFPSPVRQRGQEYAVSGRVGAIDFDGHSAGARVRGSLDYFTQWEWRDDDWLPHCSCAETPHCKHAYALGRAMLGSTRLQSATTPTLEPTPRPPVPSSARVAMAAPSQSREDTLARLCRTRDLRLRQDLLARLLQDAPNGGLSAYQSELQTILREADGELLCWRLAHEVSQRLEGWAPSVLQPFLERDDLGRRHAQRMRAVLARDLAAWGGQRAQGAKRSLRVVLRLEQGDNGQPTLRPEARITTPKLNDVRRTLAQLNQLRTEARRGGGALPADQAVLLEWLVDSHLGASDSHLYPAFGTEQRPGLFGKQLQGFLARAAGSAAAVWAKDNDPDLVARAGIERGAMIRFEHEPVQLLPACESGSDGVKIDLAFHWPDGRQRFFRDAIYIAAPASLGQVHASFVLSDGAFYVVSEQPPESLVDNFVRVGGLQILPEERSEVLGALGGRFPNLQETISTHTRYYPARAVVGLDLRDDDWMQVRIFAYSGPEAWRPGEPANPGSLCFEYSPENGWAIAASALRSDNEIYAALPATDESMAVPVLATANDSADSDPSATAEIDVPAEMAPDPASSNGVAGAEMWFVSPEPATVASVLDWLSLLGATSGTQRTKSGAAPAWPDAGIGWWIHGGRKRMEDFAAAWEARPREVIFFGTDRMRRLLTGEVRIAPRLRIQASGIDWFSVSADWEAEGRDLSEEDLAQLRVATTRFVKLSSGWVDRELLHMQEGAAEMLADLGLEVGEADQRVTLWQLAGAKAESLDALESFGADPATIAAARGLRDRVLGFAGLPTLPLPQGLKAELRPYQERGLDFLGYVSSLGIGAVLADDMGLGKTIQALAWLLYLHETDPSGGPTLVVCPASVVHNWQREVERFAPSLRVLVLTSGQSRHELRRSIPDYDLVITNFALLRLDVEEWRAVELRAVILDEAQNIKNPDAAVTQAAQALNAKHRLALTGTPLENRALDLWSIISFVNPGYLGPRSRFQQRYDRPDAPAYVRTLLAAKLRPVMLRRTKRQVATELPERIEERQDCELTKEQRRLYVAELRRSRELVDRLSGEPGGIAQNKIHILAALTRLRQICCHPALAGGAREAGSGKFEALFDLLEPILAEGHKVLVFSQFVECLKLLKQEITARGITHHMLTGQSVKREQIVDAFQSDPNPCVFLVSLKAGGTGLNLTAASYVILFDPWWNPAVEAQAIDRTHRIGQDKTVIAYRMLTTGTIEEKIYDLQQRKAAMIRDILGEEGGFARALTREDLDYLLAEG